MRMILPTATERRLVDRSLVAFFRDYAEADFRQAISALCRFYHLPRPKVEWFEYLDWGATGGRTYENGKIHLVHPENWKRGRKYNSERQWIQTVYHEIAHYLFWADAEKKADTFAYRMVRGIQNHRRTKSTTRPQRRTRKTTPARTSRASTTRTSTTRRRARS
jgi:predicted SprT family Zn-dependent metalloprotease